MNLLYITVSLFVCGTASGFPQLESFDQFFEKFGSGQFSQPTFDAPTPVQSAPTPQFAATSSR